MRKLLKLTPSPAGAFFYTLVVSDSFNRADNINPGNADTGQAWLNNNGSLNGMQIIGNRAAPIASSNQWSTVPVGVADMRVEVMLANVQPNSGLIFRFTDSANFTRVTFSTTTYTIIEAGGAGTIASGAGVFANGDVIRVDAVGSAITLYQNGVQLATAVATANFTANRAGLWMGNFTGTRLDDFKVYSVT